MHRFDPSEKDTAPETFGKRLTRRLTVMNLALRGIEADFGPEHADTFRRDLNPDLRADYVLANPPFNDSDWFRKDDDVRWQFGVHPRATPTSPGSRRPPVAS